MAGFLPNEGLDLRARILLARDFTDFVADKEIGLFTDVSPDATITEATISEPTGGGYARQTLTDGSWVIVGAQGDYPTITFTAVGSGSDYSAPVYGYFIATKSSGGTPRLLVVELDPGGPRSLVDSGGIPYEITLTGVMA